MKKINLDGKFRLSRKAKVWLTFFIVTIVLIGIVTLLNIINNFFEEHRFQFNRPIEVVLKAPIEIVKRDKPKTQIVEIVKELDLPEGPSGPIEEYICEKWGPYDCKVAVAVARAESGMREDAVGINTNKTIDVGIFQINTVHFKKDGCNLKDLVDPYKNVDCAYQIYSEQGWTPWVAFNTGRFASQLDK